LPDTTTTTLPACVASQFAATLTTDKATYASGERVTIISTVRNTGPQCWSRAYADVIIDYCTYTTISDDTDQVVWLYRTPCPAVLPSGIVLAGASGTDEVAWDQKDCPDLLAPGEPCAGPQVSPGTYRITVAPLGTAELPPQTLTVAVGQN
jgi:hypothetical protein